MRGRNRTKGPNPLTRTYESNGPDVKIRGTAQHVADKYAQLARDAQASGDPVSAENYFQHAEHYYRMIAAAQEQFKQQYGGQRFDEDGEEGDEDGFGGPPGSGQGLGDDYGDGQGYAPQQNFEPRAPVERPQAPQQRFDRNDRPQQNNRQQRFDRGGERYDRGQDRNAGDRNQGDRNDRFERPAAGGGERFDRPVNGGGERFDRPNNGERYDRQDKRDRFPRDGAPRDGQAPREFQPRDGQPPRENGRDPRQDRDTRQDREPRPEREARPEREPRPERTPYRAEPRFEDREAEAELPAANLPAFLTNPVRPTIAVETAPEDSTHREPVPAAGETEPVETGIRPRRRRTRKVEGTDTVGLDLTGEATETPAE